MFNALKSFIAEVGGKEPLTRRFDEQDCRLAAAALLVHIANVNGYADLAEQRRLKTIIESRFGLDPRRTAELIASAERRDREAVDFYHFTSLLKRALDDGDRQIIVEMLWDIAYADGQADEFEENAVWQIAELLGVSARDRVLLRQRVQARKRKEDFVSPWSMPD